MGPANRTVTTPLMGPADLSAATPLMGRADAGHTPLMGLHPGQRSFCYRKEMP